MAFEKRRETLIVLAVVAATGLFYLSTIRRGHDWGGDFAMYIRHAQNLVDGVAYADTGYIYNPHYPSLSPKTYPPVFPVLLAPVYAVFGLNLEAMKVEIVAFFLCALILIFLALRGELRPVYLVVLVALIGLSPFFWDFKDQVLSDIPFLLFLFCVFLFAKRAYEPEISAKSRSWRAALLGLFIYLACGTRSVGVVLVPAVFIFEMIRFRKPTRVFLIAMAVFAPLMVLQMLLVPSEASYFDQFSLSTAVVGKNLEIYARSLAVLFYNGYDNVAMNMLCWAASGIAVVGFVIKLAKKTGICEIFVILYAALIILWPANQGTRFLIPLIPLYFFYLLSGIAALKFILRGTVEAAVFIFLIAAIAASYFAAYTALSFGPIEEGIGRAETQKLFNYVRTKTAANDVFVFTKPRVLALFTARSASAAWLTENDDELLAYLDQIHAKYWILCGDFPEDHYFYGVIERHSRRFREVYSNRDFIVFELTEDNTHK